MLTLLELVENLELSFSQWFLLMRRKQGLTQDDIAEALGISGQSVSNWERGRSIPTLTIDQVKTLCKILDCTLNDIPSSDTE
ncbi:helix-turn-helix transcriptional regulator [Acaryochloris marina]|uniref:Helix-turn-helix domain protein n=1 Tax=Acaryochloris marina (strain MBIC 11017) TaxID=329726 RepID=A8ZMB1_ACAM1|nr:helix-turn-helix transcriptional regulator [Acaryochloris marina]ABW32322.1 helix-turn-helix domain protein [Acaryochloris marina MBIC11017]